MVKPKPVMGWLRVSLCLLASAIPLNCWADFPRLPAIEPVEIFVRESLKPAQERYYRDGFLYYLGPSKAIVLTEKEGCFGRTARSAMTGTSLRGASKALESCLTTKGVCSTRESFERVFLHVVHTSMLLGK